MSESDIRVKIGQRIAEARTKAGMTQYQLSEHSSGRFTQGRISHWEKGRRMPGVEEAIQLGILLGVSAAYLLCLSDEKTLSEHRKIVKPTTFIPLYDNVFILKELLTCLKDPAAKLPLVDFQHIPVADSADGQRRERSFAYTIADQSMQPVLNKSDTVIIDCNRSPEPGELVMAIYDNADVVIRQYKMLSPTADKKTSYELIPRNSNWPTLSSCDGSLFIVGVIYELRKYNFLNSE